jgi:hypothetical protein
MLSNQRVKKQSDILWDIVPCSLVDVHLRPGGVNCEEAATACCLLNIYSIPEDEGSTFLGIVGELLPDYTVSHSRRQSSWYY